MVKEINSKIAAIQLPFADNALEPFISAKTVDFHYRKHHAGYVNKLNELLANPDNAKYNGMELEEIIINSKGDEYATAIFNNAAQVYNHNLQWLSIIPNGGGMPTMRIAKLIDQKFDSFNGFRENFTKLGMSRFGSGWVWLSYNPEDDSLDLRSTPNADTPLTKGLIPLITCDVWEHAYYLDYQNRRNEYINVFLDHLVNWSYANRILDTTNQQAL